MSYGVKYIGTKAEAANIRTQGDDGPWHEIGASGEPAFQNSWVNYGGSWATAAFFKDRLGVVHLKGLVKNGTVGSTIFTLPSGYHTTNGHELFYAISYGAVCRVDVFYDSGAVYMRSGANNWVSLSGITLRPVD